MKQTILSLMAATLLFSALFGAEDLGEILVTSTSKLPQKVKNTTTNVNVITSEDIEERGYQSVPEVLSHISGVSITSPKGSAQPTSIYIRGMQSHDVLVMLDGITMTDFTAPYASPVGIAHINIHSVERIEVLKGSQSGTWGAGAVAGVINIVTKDSRTDAASMHLTIGSYGTKGVGFNLSKNNDLFSFSASGNLDDTDGFSAVLPRDAEKDGYNNKDLTFKAKLHTGESSTVSFFHHTNTAKYDYDSAANANSTIEHGTSKLHSYGMDYLYQDTGLMINAKASRIKQERFTMGQYGSFDTEGTRNSLALAASYTFSPDQILTLGIEQTKVDGGNTYAPVKSFKDRAVTLNYTQTFENFLGTGSTLNAVLRYDNFDIFKDKATYRFGIKRGCRLVEGLHSSFNIYSAYKAPSFYQLANPQIAGSTLLPEFTKGYEFSLGYKKLFNITYFKNKKEDELLFDYNTFKYYNAATTNTVDGIELSGEYAFENTGLIIGANLTHLFDENLPRRAQNSANLYVDYYFSDNSHLGASLRYVGERKDLASSNVKLDSYMTVDFIYNTKLTDNLKLSISAKNIFDKKYETAKGYSTEGRSIYATVEYRF